jgi:hypothetical protein
MAHAGPSEPAQPSRKQHSRLRRALRRYFALLAALLVIVLVGAGCSVVEPAKAHERNDRNRQRQHQRPTTTAAADEDDGEDDGEDEDATSTTADPAQGGGQDTTTTVDPNAPTTTVDPNASTTTVDPNATTTTVDPNATTTTVDPNATTTTVDPNAPLPFSTTECDPAGLATAGGQQTDETGAVCNTSIMGVLPAADKTPSVNITAPEDGDTFAPGEPIPCEIEFQNFVPGTFDGTGKNGQARQFALRPFSVDANGSAIGHAHCYIRDAGGGATSQLEQNPIGFVALNGASADGRTLAGVIATGIANPGDKTFCVDLAGGGHLTFPKGVAQQFPPVDCVGITIE